LTAVAKPFELLLSKRKTSLKTDLDVFILIVGIDGGFRFCWMNCFFANDIAARFWAVDFDFAAFLKTFFGNSASSCFEKRYTPTV